jgi:hypothetical protein
MARRLGPGAFLYCSAAGVLLCIGVAVAAQSVVMVQLEDIAVLGSYVHVSGFRDTGPFMIALCIFMLIFLLGALSRRLPRRSLFIALGYTGTIVLVTLCLGLVVTTKQNNAGGFTCMFAVIWLTASGLQLIMERTMYSFLYEPQP